jgi:hypothetical protein
MHHQGLSILRLLLLCAILISSFACRPPSEPPPDTPKIIETHATFLAVGDIMLSRGVAQRIKAANDPLLPFRQLETVLKSSDFNVGNLETPVSGKDQVLGYNKIFNMRVADLAGLTECKFKVLNLANNHALDQGPAGLLATRKYLEDRAVTYLGAGGDLSSAWQPKVLTANNLRIGFIGASYASINDNGVKRNDYLARIEDLDRLKEAIAQSKMQSNFTVVTMHAGSEYVEKANPKRLLDKKQIDFAHAAIDYGADLVIGTHPHWIQNHEIYSGKHIFYSLGNFIFDMHDAIANKGLMLKIALHGEKFVKPGERGSGFNTRIAQIECLPIIIELSVPRLATLEEATRILKRLDLPAKVIETGTPTAFQYY